jgi:hypothetical protein
MDTRSLRQCIRTYNMVLGKAAGATARPGSGTLAPMKFRASFGRISRPERILALFLERKPSRDDFPLSFCSARLPERILTVLSRLQAVAGQCTAAFFVGMASRASSSLLFCLQAFRSARWRSSARGRLRFAVEALRAAGTRKNSALPGTFDL